VASVSSPGMPVQPFKAAIEPSPHVVQSFKAAWGGDGHGAGLKPCATCLSLNPNLHVVRKPYRLHTSPNKQQIWNNLPSMLYL